MTRRDKKILIIGCSGYLGSYLTDFLLKKNYICEGIDIGFFDKCNLYKEKKFKIKKKSASKISENDIKKFDVVVQLAAFSNDPYGNLDSKKFYKPTTKYTIKIAKICKKHKIQFIFPSSCSVYGYGKNVFSETSKTKPLTDYSKNKIEIEKKLNKLRDDNFSPIILRLATVYGISPRIRLDVVINMLSSMAVSYKKLKLNSNGQAWRPHLNIKDVANIIEKFLFLNKNKKINNIYNIGSDNNNYKIIDVAKKIKKIVSNTKIEFLDKKDKKSLVSDKKIHDGIDKRSYKVSFLKIKKLFPEYRFINLNSGIKKFIKELESYKMNKQKFSNIDFYRLQKLDQINSKKKIVV